MNRLPKYRLFYNGKIHTLDHGSPFADALLVHDDRIIFCGSVKDVNLSDARLERFDLEQQHIFPAFTDCHTHVAAVALDLEHLRLDHCASLPEALKLIGAYTGKILPGEWVLGGGWNANIWSDGHPDRHALDNVTRQHPVALYNKDGHTQWLNTLALEKCGFNKEYADPPGGRIGRDEHGNPDGLVYENACLLVANISEKTSYEQMNRCMNKLYPQLHRLGITGVHSCEGMDKYHFFNRMLLNRQLKLRISMQPPAQDIQKLADAGIYSGFGNNWLRIGGLKYFVDGSLGSQTAEMFENYQGINHKGIEVLTESQLYEQLYQGTNAGLSSTVHAIGDKAIHKTLNAFEKLRNITTPVPLRHRIEHSQIILPDDISRFAGLNLIASMQPLHIADDVEIAEKYLGKRGRYTYPVKSLINSGCRVVFGSDMPVADPDPIKGIQAAVGRRYKLDLTQPPWQAQECISAEQAVYAYTRDAAYASYEENDKGTLTPGKLADFIVVNRNLLVTSEEQLYETVVEKTILAGEVVYSC
jgi:predicted amidohydrolase YtcJ